MRSALGEPPVAGAGHSGLIELDRPGLMSWSEKKIELALLDLKRISRERSHDFVVVTMPIRSSQSAYGFITPFLDKEEIPYLDLSADPVWTGENSGLWYKVDSHPNAKGYAHIAASVHRLLNSTRDL